MHLNADISGALELLEEIKQNVDELDDDKLLANTAPDLNLLISLLENPIFRSIVTVQDSLSELNQQLGQHPSILPVDFDITAGGELDLNVPPAGSGDLYDARYSDEFRANARDFDEQRVPSAPVSPTSPQMQHGFTVSDSKMLLIDGKSFNQNLSHHETLELMQQKAQPTSSNPILPRLDDDTIHRSPSAVSDGSKAGSDTLLGTEWVQVEAIDLVNDGTGLGFGIVGVRTMAVVVKTILPGGVADRDGRLQSGDHILQIGEVNLHEMGSEQVATVLRQSGTHVKLVVARPADLTSNEYKYLSTTAPLVPTRLIAEPGELDRYLIQHKYPPIFSDYPSSYHPDNNSNSVSSKAFNNSTTSFGNSASLSRIPASPSLPLLNLDLNTVSMIPEMEKFTVELRKDANGLGITIAGYVCEKEELSGIFVKSVSKASAADVSGKIQVNDRIVEVDGRSLQGYSNLQAVEVLRSSGNVVQLCLERYLHGPKFEQLQQAIAASEMKPAVVTVVETGQSQTNREMKNTVSSSASPLQSARCRSESEEDITHDSSVADDSPTTTTTPPPPPPPPPALYGYDDHDINIDCDGEHSDNINHLFQLDEQYESALTADLEQAIKHKWQSLLNEAVVIVVAQLSKFGVRGGLGISLEGTVDVEDGQEVRPHHYIRSILAEGPVGRNGQLRSGDELLEVNGHRLLGMNHHEVVSILKELPIHVRMVCGRSRTGDGDEPPAAKTQQSGGGFPERGILGGSLQNLLPASDRLVKAKSDGSITTTITAIASQIKSRSLEPLTGLAMWSADPQIIELVKGERGLGFSILDYQDPINANDTVIVIRSLVPGGVAQLDGRLIPGDRLLFVNDTVLENASLDQAVQALKGAPKGVVRIGVAKPLPIQLDSSNNESRLSTNVASSNE